MPPTPIPIKTATPGPATPTPSATPSSRASAGPTPTPTATPAPAAAPLDARLLLPNGFYGNTIAVVPQARQLAALPNGDLLVGTSSNTVYVVPQAEAPGVVASPTAYATLPEGPAQGVSFSPISQAVYVATSTHVYEIPYKSGDRVASSSPVAIVAVRTGSVSPTTDGDVHQTTSVLAVGNSLYIGVGSSCNACAESDATRAVVLQSGLSGGAVTSAATRIRNPIALALNPVTNHVWVGGAGQDCLQLGTSTCGAQMDVYANGHPYEYVDDLTARGSATVDYHWPDCEENHQSRHAFNAAFPSVDCSAQPVPIVEFPAFGTHIGAVYYPANQTGAYAFPPAWSGLYVTVHGSWHETSSGIPVTPPNVALVPMSTSNGDVPKSAVNWSNPTSQWSTFLQGFQDNTGQRIGRPTGLAVGSAGSLFVAEDQNGYIYRLRYGTPPTTQSVHR
jgi:glucose/arabinose dehydrogenase